MFSFWVKLQTFPSSFKADKTKERAFIDKQKKVRKSKRDCVRKRHFTAR